MAMTRRALSLLLALSVLAVGTTVIRAQDDDEDVLADIPPLVELEEPEAADPSELTVPELWEQSLFYLRTANADAALSHIQAILNRAPEPQQMYDLSLQPPTAMTQLARGSNLPGLAEPIEKLRALIKTGYQQRRSDPERINRAIELLAGDMDNYTAGRNRLLTSGEYAVPYLIQTLMDPDISRTLRARVVNIFAAIGKDAVRPLSVSLQTGDPKLQEIFANALGQIEYPHAAPRLAELMTRDGVLPQVVEAARLALVRCAGEKALGKSPAELYYQLAEKYYYRAESLRADPRTATGNVWRWREGLGLVHIEVPRPIFCDTYAQRMARLALEHDATYYAAVPLWLSAAFNAEANLPAGQTDPLRRTTQPPARFYALASSPTYLQAVVNRALDDRNTPVASAALKALVRIIGTESLLDAKPLVEAMTYPDRDVRFFAAVTLARANPQRSFEGSQMVLPILAGALRQPGHKIVLLICEDVEQRNVLKAHLRKTGYTVVESADAAQAMAAAQKYSGADAVVLGARPAARGVFKLLRSDPRYVRLPLVIAHEVPAARQLASDEPTLEVLPEQPADEALDAAIERTIAASVGTPLSPDEANRWAIAAAEAVETLARDRNEVFEVDTVLPALRQACYREDPGVRQAAARATGALGGPDAQQAVAELANDAEAPELVRLTAYTALSDSLRRYGNDLSEGLIDDVRRVAQNDSASQAIRQAAAEAFGAMGLDSEDIVPFIRSTAGTD
ncbi:MAG: HEAT repeat domain-containing protein [Phycisphaerae bacterium]|nr:HEAT repeat domain-containing protein [Phycisphaerae bacterium]